ALAIELPSDNARSRLTLVALLAANASFTCLAAAAWPALSAQHLPAIAGTNAGIITLGDKGGAVERDDVEPVCLVSVVCAADVRGAPVASVAPCMREAAPMGVRRRMQGIPARLQKRASMGDNVAFVVNAPRHIFLDTRQLASWSWRPLRSRLAVNPFEI